MRLMVIMRKFRNLLMKIVGISNDSISDDLYNRPNMS